MANRYGDTAVSNAGPPVTLGPQGYWLDAQGDVAATDPQGQPQQTPGQRDNPQAAVYYDASKDLNYSLINGTKVYQSPVTYDQTGRTVYKSSLHGAPISDTGGGALHGQPTWNPKTGSWDVGLDFGKVLSWATAAGISGGVLNAAMAGGAAAAGAGGAAGTIPADFPVALGYGGIGLSPAATSALPAATAAAGGAAGAAAANAAGGGSAGVGVGEQGATAGLAGSGYGVAPLASTTIAPTAAPLAAGVPGGTAFSAAAGGGSSSLMAPTAAGGGLTTDLLRYGVPTAGSIIGGLIQANAAGKASDAQQKYLEEALAYEKEQDALNRATTNARYNYGATLEASRYGDYSGRIAPYVASGNAANARMASLLGLPAPPPAAAASPPPSVPTLPQGSTPAPSASGSSAPTNTTQPTGQRMVLLQGPDGTQQSVPDYLVSYYTQKGAKPIGAAA